MKNHECENHEFQQIINPLIQLFLTLLVAVLSFPVWCNVVGPNIDRQWSAGMNALADRGLCSGLDFAFPYGPLGPTLIPVCYNATSPNLAWILGLFCWSLAWWIGCWGLIGRTGSNTDAFVLAIGLGVGQLLVPYAGTIPVMGILVWLIWSRLSENAWLAAPAGILAGAALLGKYSTGITSLLTLSTWVLLTAFRQGPRKTQTAAVMTFFLYVFTVSAVWFALGFPIQDIWTFLRNNSLIASGYADQMSEWASESILEWMPILIVFVYPALWILAKRDESKSLDVLILLAFPVLFLTKWYITRVDGYRLILVTLHLAGIWALPLAARPGAALGQALRYLTLGTAGTGVLMILAALGTAPLLSGPTELLKALRWNATLIQARNQAEENPAAQQLPPDMLERIGNQTVEAHGSFHYFPILHHKLRWSPRPVMQSILVCAPELDRRCADFYDGENGPRFVLVPDESIARVEYPLMDSQSWIALSNSYEAVLTSEKPSLILMERRKTPRWGPWVEFAQVHTRIGQPVTVPAPLTPGAPVMARYTLTPNTLGKIRNILHKFPPVKLRILWTDDTTDDRKIYFRNAAEGFLASDLPKDFPAYVRWLQGKPGSPVKTLTFLPSPGIFAPDIEIRFFTAEVLSKGEAPADAKPTP